MKNQFTITGYYYQIKKYKFRKYLEIKRNNTAVQIPDLMVVMMNPGSSKPINNDDDGRTETEAIHDNTQTQIMKIMQVGKFNYARILNLSDIREPKSKLLYKKLEEMDADCISHSIFDPKRKNEFDNLWIKNTAVIFGWGVNYRLRRLAQKAIELCNTLKPLGLQKPNYSWAYYHPLPPNANIQKDWVKKVSKQLKTG